MRQSWRRSAKKYCLFCTKSLRSCGVLIKTMLCVYLLYGKTLIFIFTVDTGTPRVLLCKAL